MKKFSETTHPDIPAINERLAEIEKEREYLLTLREEIKRKAQRAQATDSLSPEQKISIFSSIFQGRTDIFATRWQNKRDEAVTQLHVIMNGLRAYATNQGSNARIVITDNSLN